MIEKQVQFFGKTASGIFCQSLFGSSGTFEKVAGAPAFSDWENGDVLRQFIGKISKQERQENAFVLVNALGAGEYFGSNINADHFPWMALTHEGDDYGYKTFLRAHAFQHHINKDPSRAFGQPVLSLLNSSMKRVELVVRLNREKARAEGADGIITRIDNGEFPDVSMGCKVPYDVCYVCEHRSKTKDDYCVHMKPPEDLRHLYGPNKILPDGKKCCVKNLHPRFFDISFVFIGADKTAKVMAKLASKGTQVCLGDVCTVPRLSSEVHALTAPSAPFGQLEKAASASCHCGCAGSCSTTKQASRKTAAQTKVGEIIKTVPGGVFAMRKLDALEAQEPDLSNDVLDEMARGSSLGECCNAASALGIILKPREFQRITLIRIGHGSLADDLDRSHRVFKHGKDFDDSASSGSDEIRSSLINLLADYILPRSGFGAPLNERMSRAGQSKKTLPTKTSIDHPLLNKISAAYNGYRQSLMKKLSQVEKAVQNDPKLRDTLTGNTLVNMFTKTSSAPVEVITPYSITYFAGVHFPDRTQLYNSPVDTGAVSRLTARPRGSDLEYGHL